MIHWETRGAVAVLRMEHGKVNALDIELLESLSENLRKAESSGSTAIVLTGSGTAFSAGVDLFRVLNGGEEYLHRFLPLLSSVLEQLFLFQKPVVAAVNGHAIAGGCIMTCACDYRLMARGAATIGATELRVGVPFPAMPLEILRFAVAPQYVQEVVYSGRAYSVEEALQRGLIDEIADPEALLNRACDAAGSYGEIPGESFRITKRRLRLPVLELVADDPLAGDVMRQWTSPEIHAFIRNYLRKTIGQK